MCIRVPHSGGWFCLRPSREGVGTWLPGEFAVEVVLQEKSQISEQELFFSAVSKCQEDEDV